MNTAPTLYLGLRLITTTPLYDDPDHPDRPTTLIQSPAWTAEDRGLLLGLELAEADLCRCGQPRSVAWHSDMDGDIEADVVVCFGCTAIQGEKVKYAIPRITRDFTARPLPPFQFGLTTTDD